MRPWRFPLAKASSWMIVLGVLVSAAAAASAIADARQSAAGLDPVGDAGGSSQDFVPLLTPMAATTGQMGAPTLPPSAAGLSNTLPATLASALPTTRANGNPATQPTITPPTSALATASPTVPSAPPPIWNPDRIVIPAIKLDAPTVPAKIKAATVQGQLVPAWVAPNAYAAGWLTTSVPLGVPGNTVLVGHNNVDGEVFGHLVDLKVGDVILMYSGDTEFAYRVALTLILPERFQKLDVRLANARWIEPSQDTRLTLVTCWPYASNTHRLIVVATPISLDDLPDYALTPRLTPHPPLDWQSTPASPPQDVLPGANSATGP